MPFARTPAYGSNTFSATQSVSVDFGSNANRGLLGEIFFDNNFNPGVPTLTSVVIDPGGAAVSCTIGARRSGTTVLGVPGYFYAFWASGASVPTGVKTVTATSNDANGKPRMWCLPIDDATAISAEAVSTGLSLTPSVTVSSAAGQVVFGLMSAYILDSQTVTPTAPATQVARVLEAAAAGLAGAMWQEAGAASVTLDGAYTGATARWAMTAWSVTGAVGTAPSITTQPSNQTVTAPATATFTVAATGTGTLTYQWQRNPLGTGSFANISGATSASYTTPATTVTGGSANNADTYRCVVTGDTAPPATSNAATLTVNASVVAPTVTLHPSNQSVAAGGTATFSAAATGTPTPTVQWYRNGQLVSGATSLSYTTPPAVFVGDPQFATRSALLKFNGANLSTAFVDSSSYAHVCTAVGNARITTAQTVLGGSTLDLDGTGDGVDLAYSAALNLQGVNWSVQGRARVNPGVTTGAGMLFDFRGPAGSNAASWCCYVSYDTRILSVFDGVSGLVSPATPANSVPVSGTWFAWEVSHQAGTTRIFIDGVLVASSATFSTPATHASGVRVGITNTGTLSWNGQQKELRITKGAAVNTANYTPDAVEFPIDVANYEFVRADFTNAGGVAQTTNARLTVSAALFGVTFGPFAVNTGAGQRAPGEAFDWWAFAGVVIGGDIDAATRRRGSGTLNGSGLAVVSGLPAAGSWEVQLRFPGDAEPEKGTMRDTLTAA